MNLLWIAVCGPRALRTMSASSRCDSSPRKYFRRPSMYSFCAVAEVADISSSRILSGVSMAGAGRELLSSGVVVRRSRGAGAFARVPPVIFARVPPLIKMALT